jgi:hypothetical protein
MTNQITGTVCITEYSGLGYGFEPKAKCWHFVALDTRYPLGWRYECAEDLQADLHRFVKENWGDFA